MDWVVTLCLSGLLIYMILNLRESSNFFFDGVKHKLLPHLLELRPVGL